MSQLAENNGETRQSSEELDEGAESLRRFQASISKFGFAGASSKQSPMKAISDKSGMAPLTTGTRTTSISTTKMFASQSSKRSHPEDDPRLPLSELDASPSKKLKGKKPARGYASPEVYAHLNPVNDCLSESLDSESNCSQFDITIEADSEMTLVVFCGVKYVLRRIKDLELIDPHPHSPGQRSAETGHHFGHPSNHFWKCLHLSGLTSERIPPNEDFTVLERFQLGLVCLL